MIKAIILILIGFALLIKGADLLVEGASKISKRFHIPEIIIGLTIVSIGTSMPELFVSITSAIERIPRYGYRKCTSEAMRVIFC